MSYETLPSRPEVMKWSPQHLADFLKRNMTENDILKFPKLHAPRDHSPFREKSPGRGLGPALPRPPVVQRSAKPTREERGDNQSPLRVARHHTFPQQTLPQKPCLPNFSGRLTDSFPPHNSHGAFPPHNTKIGGHAMSYETLPSRPEVMKWSPQHLADFLKRSDDDYEDPDVEEEVKEGEESSEGEYESPTEEDPDEENDYEPNPSEAAEELIQVVRPSLPIGEGDYI
ncbi:hypothetical protein CRUP_020021, partial [Coryphaenoides rupestris]